MLRFRIPEKGRRKHLPDASTAAVAADLRAGTRSATWLALLRLGVGSHAGAVALRAGPSARVLAIATPVAHGLEGGGAVATGSVTPTTLVGLVALATAAAAGCERSSG